MIKLLDLLKEGASQTYDDLIKKTLKVEELPVPVGDYSLGNNGTVNSSDLKLFKELYKVAPPKAGKEESEAGSKGSGHGEIAMYWLLSKGYSVQDGRGGGKPDLIVDGVGVEVKSYEETKIALGRVGSDKASIEMLSVLFGLETLVSSLEGGDKKKRHASAMTFNKGEIVSAFSTLRDFSANEELRSLSKKYSLIGNIYAKVDTVLSKFNLQHDFNPEEAAGALTKQILLTKLNTKPGFGGYLVNVSESGKIGYTQISKDKVGGIDNTVILDNVYLNQGQLVVNTSIFG